MAKAVAEKDRSAIVLLGAGALVVGGLVWASRRGAATKRAGDTLTVGISFRHRWQGEGIWAGVGWAAPSLFSRVVTDITYTPASVSTDPDWKSYKVLHQATVPNLPAGKYDIFVFLQRAGGTLNPDGTGYLKARWYDGRISITGGVSMHLRVVAEAERIAAEFSQQLGELVAGLGKLTGSPVGATGSFSHLGAAETPTISWGVAPGDSTPGITHQEKLIWVQSSLPVPVGADAIKKTYPFSLSGSFPAIPADWWSGYLTGKVGFIDCYIVVQRPDGSVAISRWWDDVYETVASEYADLAATFT